MTEKEIFETIIAVLTEKVQEQKTELGYVKWQNENLKTQLAEAEKHL